MERHIFTEIVSLLEAGLQTSSRAAPTPSCQPQRSADCSSAHDTPSKVGICLFVRKTKLQLLIEQPSTGTHVPSICEYAWLTDHRWVGVTMQWRFPLSLLGDTSLMSARPWRRLATRLITFRRRSVLRFITGVKVWMWPEAYVFTAPFLLPGIWPASVQFMLRSCYNLHHCSTVQIRSPDLICSESNAGPLLKMAGKKKMTETTATAQFDRSLNRLQQYNGFIFAVSALSDGPFLFSIIKYPSICLPLYLAHWNIPFLRETCWL